MYGACVKFRQGSSSMFQKANLPASQTVANMAACSGSLNDILIAEVPQSIVLTAPIKSSRKIEGNFARAFNHIQESSTAIGQSARYTSASELVGQAGVRTVNVFQEDALDHGYLEAVPANKATRLARGYEFTAWDGRVDTAH